MTENLIQTEYIPDFTKENKSNFDVSDFKNSVTNMAETALKSYKN